ncbi:M48 family metalloprotease [Tepidicella baoligensis]|uniref:M48 family metalloprotease n=1 Tax=Tepidicella baoligensis TaxID=2707016 RepID=UPI0015D9A4BE|nr:M48 family metalloprotease [Tepidicella baoligensis]
MKHAATPYQPLHEQLSAALGRQRLSRRQALWLLGASVSATSLGALQGCAQSPVTGERILVGMSESQERAADAQYAPHQFSEDLGAIQDDAVNRYVSTVGAVIHQHTHRPQMPYSYRVLNANYVNAYTFPAGSMGVTRGILVNLQDEAELAALLGHEMGHVNARHAAQRSGQGLLASVALMGMAMMVDDKWADVALVGGQIGASALLASYSRDNEREADALGQEYLVRAGYPANGMTHLHQLLVAQEKQAPSLLQTMFSSHPMSTERVATAERLAQTQYAHTLNRPNRRERFMDETASLRRLKPTIEACQQGEMAMSRKQLPAAQTAFAKAIQATPQDYAANLRMAQCLQAMGKTQEARSYALNAQNIYPQEAQAHKVAGVLALQLRQPQQAYEHLTQFDRQLPGNPGITFLRGVALEGMGNRREAAVLYQRFLQTNIQGQAAQYAASRLQAWGVR